jgi:hypothetical protein
MEVEALVALDILDHLCGLFQLHPLTLLLDIIIQHLLLN